MERKFIKQTYTVRCPDCGSLALRTHTISYPHQPSTRTECPSCDYLLVIDSDTGKVIDTHSSIASIVARNSQVKHLPLTLSISPREAA